MFRRRFKDTDTSARLATRPRTKAVADVKNSRALIMELSLKPDTRAHVDHSGINAWNAATGAGRQSKAAIQCRGVLSGALFFLITLTLNACDPSAFRHAGQATPTEAETNVTTVAPPPSIALPLIDRDIPRDLETATFALG